MTWGIHTHNDAELAVANTLAAVAAGARHVQATINGYGERCGNANMVSVMANLALKTDLPLRPVGGGDISHLTTLSRTVAEIANVTPLDYQPFVGRSAFAHKGGVHGAAVAKVERSYQHVDPVLVGNVSRLVVSELGGRANTRIRAEQLGHDLEGVDARALSQTIKELENQGLAFEGAEASFELLIRRKGADYRPPFEIVDYTVLSEQREGHEFLAEATVKVRVDGEVLHTAADGNGPVNALDAAMRKALGAFFPQLESMRLVDYKVRIIDGDRRHRRAHPRHHRLARRGARVVDDGLRHEHHLGLGGRPRRFVRVRHLEAPDVGCRSDGDARRAHLGGRPEQLPGSRADPPGPATDGRGVRDDPGGPRRGLPRRTTRTGHSRRTATRAAPSPTVPPPAVPPPPTLPPPPRARWDPGTAVRSRSPSRASPARSPRTPSWPPTPVRGRVPCRSSRTS